MGANEIKSRGNKTASTLRRLAEKALEKKSGINHYLSDKSPEDITKLVHELSVHQIELEMQNEELQRIQAELEKTKSRYSHLYDFAPISYATINEKGVIVEANLTMAVMLGVERSDLVGKMLSNFILKDDQDIYYKHRQRLIETGASQTCDIRLVKKDGQPFFARLECMIIKTRDDEFGEIRAAISNISENKRMEESLTRSIERLDLATNAARIGIWDWDIQKNELIWDDRMFELYGVKREDFPGAYEAWLSGVHPDDRAARDEESRQARSGEKNYDTEFRVLHKDGTIRVLKAYGQVVRDSKGNPIRMTGTNYDITALKQAEEELQKEHDLSENLIETAQVVILMLDTAGRIVRFNPYMEELSGYRLEEVKGMDWFSTFLPTENGEKVKTLFSNAISNIQTHGNVNSIISKDGREIFIEWYDKTLKDSYGNTIGLLAVGLDVTERKQHDAEREITLNLLQALHQENHLHELIQNIILLMQAWSGCESVGVRLREGDDYPYFETRGFPSEFVKAESRLCSVDNQGELVRDPSGNPVLECMCGNIISGRFNPDLPFFTKTGSFWTNSTSDLLASTTEADRQVRTRNRCNGEGYESVALIPLHVGKNRIGLLQFNDHRRNRFDKEKIELFEHLASNLAMGLSQRITALALSESEEKYRSLYEEAPVGYIEIDSEGRISNMNQKQLEMFGYTAEEMKGRFAWDFVKEKEESRKDIMAKLSGAAPPAKGLEHNFVRKDGTTFPALIDDLLVRDSNGQITCIRSICRDISDLKQAEKDNVRLVDQLQQAQKMESIGTLAGGIAHDFNNILSPIMLHTEMAMDDLAPDDPLQHDMKEIFKASERARDLVKQILTFARKRPGEKILLKSSMIVKDAIKFLRSTIPTTIDIKFNNKAKQDTILADPTQLNQIVMNLCTNSAYAMREKGGELEVTLDNEDIAVEKINRFISLKPCRYLRLSVSDTGTGISPDIIDRIFEPYYTTKGTGEGTGLGLSIIHGIIKNYGGDIDVESEIDHGTTFYVYLPLIEEEILSTDNCKAELPSGVERILLVDDEKAAVDALQKTLKRLGYKVTGRTESSKALETFSNDPEMFDLVITDMTMPHMTGAELVKKIMVIRPGIPVILCTGFSDKIDEQKAKEIGISAFVMKPVVMSEIAKTIRDVLDKEE